MVSHAATATTHPVITTTTLLVLLAAALIVTVCYLGACWLFPFGHCRRCEGSGRRPSPSGRTFRLCRRCDGTGRRLRIGRHVLNYLRERRDHSADRANSATNRATDNRKETGR